MIFDIFCLCKVGIRPSFGVMRSLERGLALLLAAVAEGLLADLSILRPAALWICENTLGDEFHGANNYIDDKSLYCRNGHLEDLFTDLHSDRCIDMV